MSARTVGGAISNAVRRQSLEVPPTACTCPFEISYRIAGLEKKDYTVKVEGPHLEKKQ
jgi:hypothetical protein